MPGPRFSRNLAIGRVLRHRLQQLDARLAAGDHRHPHPLVRHLLDRLDVEPHRLVEPLRLVDRADRDPDVVDLPDHSVSHQAIRSSVGPAGPASSASSSSSRASSRTPANSRSATR